MTEPDASSIKQITEMGFTYEEAVSALKATNGDVHDALNYMFNPQEAVVPSYETTQQPNNQQLSVKTPLEPGYVNEHIYNYNRNEPPMLPDRPSDTNLQSMHIENIDSNNIGRDTYLNQSDDDSNYDEEFNNEGEILDSHEYPYSVFDQIEKYKRPHNSPPVLMPLNGGVYESYLNPILTIFHEIPSLRKAIYHYSFESLGFHPNWFKGETISVPSNITTIQKDKESYDLRFLLEIQRLFGFLDGDSDRAFTSIKNFIKSFPKDIQGKFGAVDNVKDAYELFSAQLSKELELSGSTNTSVFFQNVLLEEYHEEAREFGMFQVEADEIKKDIYRTLHNLLWGGSIDNTQTISKLADIITISLEPSFEDDFVPIGLDIDDIIYPQIYTTEFKPFIDQLIEKRKSYDDKGRFYSSLLQRTKIHNGKSIVDNLDSSIKFLSSELEIKNNNDSKDKTNETLSSAIKDLEKIQIDLKQRRLELIETQQNYQELKHSINIYNPKVIIEESGIENLEPYILTGIIFKPQIFVYLTKKKNPMDDDIDLLWNYVEFNEDGRDFSTRIVKFVEIKRALHAFTSNTLESTIILTYVKEEKFLEEINISIPESVKEFITKDKTELEKILELLSETDDESNTEEILVDLPDPDSDKESFEELDADSQQSENTKANEDEDLINLENDKEVEVKSDSKAETVAEVATKQAETKEVKDKETKNDRVVIDSDSKN